MWFLQRKNMPKRWLRLAILVSLVHIILVAYLFFVYRDGISHLAFIITQQTLRRDIEFRVAVETIPKHVPVSAPLKTGVVASAKKSTISAKKQTTIAQVVEKKVTPKPYSAKASKGETKKSAVPAKPIVAEKKVEAVPKPVIAKNETPKQSVEQKPKEVPPVISSNEMTSTSKLDERSNTGKQEHVDLHMIASQNLQGFEQEFGALYEDIAAHWSPPPGVPADCACTITITIDRQGMMTDINVDNASGMLVYDLAARAAVSELQFPKVMWGKSITITFTV